MVAGGLFTGACGSDAGGGPTWSVIDDPALASSEPIVMIEGATTANGTQGPAYLGGARRDGDRGLSRPAIWSSTDGVAWKAITHDAFAQDDGWINAVASDGAETVAVGSFREGDVYVPAVWTSPREGEWEVTALKLDDGSEAEFSAVAPTGEGRFVATGGSVKDGLRRLVIATGSAGGDWSISTIAGSDDAFASSVAAGGGTMVVTANVRELAGTRPTAWMSSDDGDTWRELSAGALGETGAGETGAVAWAGDTFIAVGTNVDGTALTARTSSDGLHWEQLPAEVDGAPIDLAPTSAVWLGGALLVVGSPTSQVQFPVAAIVQPGGVWQVLGSTNSDSQQPPQGPGPATPLLEHLLFVTPIPRSVEIFKGGAEPGFVAAGTEPFPACHPFMTGNGLAVAPSGVVIAGDTGPECDIRSISYQPTLWTGRVDALKQSALADVNSISTIVTGDDGSIVVAGFVGGSGRTAEGTDYNDAWVGTVDANGSLTRKGGIEGPGEQLVTALSQHGGRWYLAGAEQPDASHPEQHAAIWSSPDLLEWTAEEGDFDTDLVAEVCGSGSQLIGVGAVKDDTRVSHPAVWSSDGDGPWTLLDLPTELGAGVGHLNSCVTSADGVMAIGVVDDQPVVVRVDQAGEVTSQALDAERYQQVDTIVRSEHGYVIVGTDSRRLLPRPSLWVSRDGEQWQRSEGPSYSGLPSGASAAAFDGDRLLVLGHVGTAVGFWSVEDVFAGL